MRPSSVLLLSVLVGCSSDPSGDPDPTTTPTPTPEPTPTGTSCAPELDGGAARVAVGSVVTLPLVSDPACAGQDWTLEASPGLNAVVVGSDGFARVVVDAPGAWTFALGDGRLVVEVVAEAPFHNLVHPPSRSLLAVGDELWAATGYAPTVARLSRTELSPVGEITVGSWPVALAATPDGATVLVAQAGDDHLGVIDVAAGRSVDAIWVGDEPSGVVVSPDGTTAYVALSTAEEVAVVDLVARVRTGSLPAPRDARALALSADGATLYVAGHRTGAPARYPFGVDPAAEVDLLAVDTGTGAVVTTFLDVASTITDLELDEGSGRLFVSGTVSHPERGLVDPENPPFEGVVQAWDLLGGARLGEAVLGRASPSEGMVLGPQALARVGDTLWVVAEGSSLAVALDVETLAERVRVPVEGHPRDLLVADGQLYSHGSQAFVVQALDEGGVVGTGAAGVDPRPPEIAAGQRGFVSPGEAYGANYSCNSCHTDGRGDTRVWPAGPFEEWEASRAMFWLEGTAPLGWSGYVDDVRTFGYTGYTSIIAKWPTSEMAEDLASFLGSLMPPAAANGHTARDGSLSEAGLRGQALYGGEAACASCHPVPLTTTNATLPEGITPKKSSIPSLVGAYRHNVWLKTADAPTLRDSVVAALDWLAVDSLDDAEVDDLTRYLQELTDRDLFLLAHEPRLDGPVGAGTPLELTFNQPIWDDAGNRGRIGLTVDGQRVDADVVVDGRRVTVTPGSPLPFDADVVVVAEAGLEAFDGRTLPADAQVAFRTAGAPTLRMEGEYQLVVDLPIIDFENGGFDSSFTLPIRSELLAVAARDGAALDLDLGRGLRWATAAVIDGDQLHVPPAPLSFGFSLAQGGALSAQLIDLDGDGVADEASGETIMSGPAFYEEGIAWTLRRPATGCVVGSEGDVEVEVTVDGDVAVIDWGTRGALGLYVTDYGANLPVGPGQTVSGGEAYWVLASTAFPLGFSGPVTYGEVPARAEDASVENGAPESGAPLESGRCYQFSVTNDRFQSGSTTLVWP